MVQLEVVQAANAALVKARPLVAVFIGGTAGIGEYAVRALATAHGSQGRGLRAYIVGRNESAAEKIIAECRQMCPPGHFRFVQATNLSLLKDVDRTCAEIIRLEEEAAKIQDGPARVDLLVMTQGVLSLSGRAGTSPTCPCPKRVLTPFPGTQTHPKVSMQYSPSCITHACASSTNSSLCSSRRRSPRISSP
jgi:NAD(P)-dependent dehydrogenase (short-subunit alcohol dehydrogenase family)